MARFPKTFVGFGFGPIQAGLFVCEAFRGGKFERLVVAEIAAPLVQTMRSANGRYRINVATAKGIEVQEVCGVEILNPQDPADTPALASALAEASEICTALPSVDFYTKGRPSVAALIAEAVRRKAADDTLPRCIVYTAENHNHAAEILERHSCEQMPPLAGRTVVGRSAQFLNTVIGKMSGVVTDPGEIRAEGLAPLVEGASHAFLVEEFNRILIDRIVLPGFQRSISAFVEKSDLLPFEEAKLYGHNAIHALLGYLAHRLGFRFMSEAASRPGLLDFARQAFLQESGAALIARHHGFDALFTPTGWRSHAEDLMERMTNPFLRDRVDRVIRDPRRKLAWNDRFIGAMRLGLDAGLSPSRLALGAAAAVHMLNESAPVPSLSEQFWPEADEPIGRKSQLIELIGQARIRLAQATF